MNNEKSQIKIGIVLNYFNIIVGSLIPVFYTPVMLRLLGQNEYGLYKLASTFTSYLSLVALGIGSAVTRYLIKAKTEKGQEEEERYFALFMVIFRVIAIAAFFIGLGLVFTIDLWYGESLNTQEIYKMKIIVFILVCNTSINFALSPYISVVSARQKFVFLQSINFITTCCMPILNLIVLYMGFASIGMATSSLFLNIIVQGIYYLFVRKKLKIKPNYKDIPKDVFREILTFSLWIFVGNIVDKLYNSTDTILIGMIPTLATTGVAVYNIGATFNNITANLSNSMKNILSPNTNKMVFEGATRDELTDYLIKTGRIQAYIMGLVTGGFVAFGRPFIFFYAGEDYSESYWVAVFMMVPYLIPMVQNVFVSVLVAENKHKFRSLTYLAIAVINVIASWFAMKVWGVIGAALVTGIALLIGQGFVMNWYYRVKMGLDTGKFWRNIIKIFFVPFILTIIAIIVQRYVDFYSIPILLIGIVIYSMLFVLINWLVNVNEYEKNIIISPLKKVIARFKK